MKCVVSQSLDQSPASTEPEPRAALSVAVSQTDVEGPAIRVLRELEWREEGAV